MRHTVFACLLIGCSALTAQTTGLTTLRDLQDTARPLLVFAPSPTDPRMEIQIRTILEHAADARERNLVILGLPYKNPSPTDAKLSPEEATALRRRFRVDPNEFRVVLLGKDGSQKLVSSKVLRFEELARTIDAMPMRQEEMRRAPPH